ncbi:hypothetical protein [Acidocella facilis]|uniref:hypothetical protein n=1 Tax=Acidocella facilis TaxID=525 RepID=UPI001F2EBFD8|nr:hypothetical protein [Acidocella facilis]
MSDTRGGVVSVTTIARKADGTPITLPLGYLLPTGDAIEEVTLLESINLTLPGNALQPLAESTGPHPQPNGPYPAGAVLTVWSYIAGALRSAGVVA